MTTVSERRVTAPDGVSLSVIEAGDAERPTLVLVHGYPDTKEVWSEVVARLDGRFHVVAYDVRGAGASDRPPALADYDLDRLVDDFLAVADAVSPDAPIHLVGHDWGSIQGWEMATVERTRGRIASFTSMCGPCLDHVGHWLRARTRHPSPPRLAAALDQLRRSWYVAVFQVPGLPPLAWRTVIGPRWPRLLERAEGVPTTADYPSPTAAQDGATGVRLYRRNMPRRVRHPRTDAVAHAPVQLVVPTKDPFVSPALYDGLERWVPTLRRRTLVAGHWAPRTHADAVARWIGEFADDVDGGHPLGRRERRSPLVLVTGAGSGIGRATALAFAREGAEVIAVDVDGPSAGDTARECEAVGANAHAETADVADASAMDDLAKRVRDAYGTLDVLVNNAGVGAAGPFLASSLDDWRRVLSVNLWGVIHGCRLFGRQMVDRGEGGHIVNVSSAAAFQPSRALPLYSTSKAGVLMLTECLRAEFADAGIGVTAICPGLINTNITRTTTFAGVSAEEQERLRARTTRLYRRRNFGPERVAADIVRAVRQNRAVVPVSPEAKAALALHRFAPGILRRLARVELS